MIGVYGANGFIGRHLVRRLAEKRIATRAVSRTIDPNFAGKVSGVEFLQADLRQPLDMASSLQDVDCVIQLISTSSPAMGNAHIVSDIEENIIPHVAFLANCLRSGVKRFIFISSGGTVYGPDAKIPTPESEVTIPICSHGITKLTLEKYIQMLGYTDNLDYVILRLSNPFGPGQEFRKGQGLVPAILNCWRKGHPIKIFGNGQATRDYIFIDDAIDAIEAALAIEGNPRLILNIGSGELRSVIEVVETVEKIIGQPFQREYHGARATDVDVAGLDISRAMATLKWHPKTGFFDGLRKTIEANLADHA